MINLKRLLDGTLKHFQENIESFNQMFISQKENDSLNVGTAENDDKKVFWSDDLRKGAFQFVQIDNESLGFQPKVNEIVFRNASVNHRASMTWCYPELRALTKIEVSPVPFRGEADEQHRDAITCYLQYWNSTCQEYVNFGDFVLSETENFTLDLPDLNSCSVAVSNKWRVLLDCGTFVDEDGILAKENPYLSPLALAACMSIDSYYDATLVPTLQFRASFDLAKLIFYNCFEKSGSTPKLHPFEFDEESPFMQEIAILSFINPSCSYSKMVSKVKGQVSTGMTCELLEYRNLTLLPIISPVDIHLNASIKYDKENIPVIEMDIVLHPCFIRLSQSIVHSFSYTVYSISQELGSNSESSHCSEYMLPNYYMICNNLEERIRFGQAATEENIILSPLKMHAYSWWCHKKKQVLWISTGSSQWKWSEGFSLNEEGTFNLSLDNNKSAIIKIKKLSNLQYQVIIDGNLMFHNQLSYPIQLRCELPAFPKDPNSLNLHYIKSLSPSRSSPAFLLSDEQHKKLRLTITGVIDSQLWSDTIVFGDNKSLLVPFEGGNRTVWCQVISRRNSVSSSVVVFISPLFILRSHLPITLGADVSDNDEEVCKIELTGHGKEVHISPGSSKEKALHLTFHSKWDLDIAASPFTILESDLNKVSLKSFNEHENLFEICRHMQSTDHIAWPYSFSQRMTISHDDIQFPCFEQNVNVTPAVPSSNVCCKVKIDVSQQWIGLNTISFDIKPRVVLVNRLLRDLYVFSNGEIEWMLPENSVALPSDIHEEFYLSVEEGGEFFKSAPLKIEDHFEGKKKTSIADATTGMMFRNSFQTIPQSGSINVLIKMDKVKEEVFLFKLLADVHEGILVITAYSIVILENQADSNLIMSLFCMENNPKNQVTQQKSTAFLCNGKTGECCPLLTWKTTSDVYTSTSPVVLDFYISIAIDNYSLWSPYICFESLKLLSDSRFTISVPVPCESEIEFPSTLPLVITSHLRNGILFLLVNIDPCPLLLLHNKTEMDIFYVERTSNGEGPIDDKFGFEVSCSVLKPGSSAYYSFPSLQKQFPVVSDKLPLLCLAVKEEHLQTLIWSTPFNVNIDKQFVNILGVCDFIVSSVCVGHTINLCISPVNRIEVSANEVRSRIALAVDGTVNVERKKSFKATKSTSKKSVESNTKYGMNFISIKTPHISSLSEARRSYIFFVDIRMIHISFILCDEFKEINKSKEVLRLNIDNIIFRSRPQNNSQDHKNIQAMSLYFEHIQLDNQMDEEGNALFDFPVVLHRHVKEKNQDHGVQLNYEEVLLPNRIRENSLFILNVIVELPNDAKFIIQSVDFDLLPVCLRLEDNFYYKIIDTLKTFIPFKFHQHITNRNDVFMPEDVKYISTFYTSPLHFQRFTFNIQEISLSLHASLKLYLSLENSSLRFKPFEQREIFTTSYELGRILILHYFTGALFRAGWVVGSLDLLGNPAGFARAVGAGVSDFVYLPYMGLFHGPQAFVSGLSSGAISLFTQISSGALTCVASLASSVSKNMDFLSLDNEHLARQELLRRRPPSGISDGLTQGLSAFGISILGAVAGIVDHPLQVLVSPSTPFKTASRIIGGLGKGIVGVIAKPIGGAAELLSQAGYGILHGAGWINPLERRYQPVTMSGEVVASSLLKYASKVTLCQSLGDILISVEATYVNEFGDYEKNILLLTSEALCILADDEVTFQRTFALTEIVCKKSESDRSSLVIMPNDAFRKPKSLESEDVLDRVAEYLEKNGEPSNTGENSLFGDENVSESCIKSTCSCYIFFLYPKDRNVFLPLFNFAKSKALRKGY